ncbi:molybdopterin molybdotransferase MoeA [Geomesophilobacter sediminis]|uniref:Molybdopterin molybdenumtransferase n=1 Tax=Geomesophilobacter sediminis TaxID=2798584 RepID=A0A8J7JLV0_9BACT|nr:gephyrin-like molybdotransferase Glp [Geomesophilobacter sediminis]MBJ6725285.1 molybdopterin molybdotransferase MoeA [Geomesophilobacter sediminis]
MPGFEEARRIILANVQPLGEERVPLLDALGRVVSQDLAAPWDHPLCDFSAMDGFAVRAADCAHIPVTLTVTDYLPAGGSIEGSVAAGCANKIMTGAPTPPGSDAIVPIEEVTEGEGTVTVREPVRPGQHIRRQGDDLKAGTVIFPAGTVIRPAEVSMLASMGKAVVPVRRRARVAILSTGDELIDLGQSPTRGKVINSNALSLAAAVRDAGGVPVLLGIARDNRESHREKMLEGLKCDVLITSAGVSAGDRDLVRAVLAELGARQLFWKIDIKPGGPTAFAVKDGIPVFSLPGNPVSTMVTFELFVRPALMKMMGHPKVIRPFVKGVLAEDVRKKQGKLNFIRVRIEKEDGRYLAYSAGDQHTGVLSTIVRSDALAALPLDAAQVPAGTEVDLLFLHEVDLQEEPR